MTLYDLVSEGRKIWGGAFPFEDVTKLQEIVIRMGVGYGDLCRLARGATKDPTSEQELMKELGNMIASTARWCDDLGLDVEECVQVALSAQRKFARENPKR